ncbi:hypothetical protein K525DRAFT_274995 [Schizophyllum commune Loenen D]|nr:hypothetical protein K525DRAFT_274995 [Schizophyllum commune Loenen D]
MRPSWPTTAAKRGTGARRRRNLVCRHRHPLLAAPHDPLSAEIARASSTAPPRTEKPPIQALRARRQLLARPRSLPTALPVSMVLCRYVGDINEHSAGRPAQTPPQLAALLPSSRSLA